MIWSILIFKSVSLYSLLFKINFCYWNILFYLQKRKISCYMHMYFIFVIFKIIYSILFFLCRISSDKEGLFTLRSLIALCNWKKKIVDHLVKNTHYQQFTSSTTFKFYVFHVFLNMYNVFAYRSNAIDHHTFL